MTLTITLGIMINDNKHGTAFNKLTHMKMTPSTVALYIVTLSINIYT